MYLVDHMQIGWWIGKKQASIGWCKPETHSRLRWDRYPKMEHILDDLNTLSAVAWSCSASLTGHRCTSSSRSCSREEAYRSCCCQGRRHLELLSSGEEASQICCCRGSRHLGVVARGPLGATVGGGHGGVPGLVPRRRAAGARGKKRLIGGWTGPLDYAYFTAAYPNRGMGRRFGWR
jgi:hypothetical protein